MLTTPICVILISYACIVFYCACIVFSLFNIIYIIRQQFNIIIKLSILKRFKAISYSCNILILKVFIIAIGEFY